MKDKLDSILKRLFDQEVKLFLNKELREELIESFSKDFSDEPTSYKGCLVGRTYSDNDKSFVSYKENGKYIKIFVEDV